MGKGGYGYFLSDIIMNITIIGQKNQTTAINNSVRSTSLQLHNYKHKPYSYVPSFIKKAFFRQQSYRVPNINFFFGIN